MTTAPLETRTRLASNLWRLSWPNFLLLLLMIAASIYHAGLLPELIPTRFDLNGSPIAYGSRRIALLLLPGIYLFHLFLLPAIIRLSARGRLRRTPSSQRIVSINTAVGALILCIHLGYLRSSILGAETRIDLGIVSGIAFFMIFLGLTLKHIEPNDFIGIRTPWSLNSESAWRATHRFASRISFTAGLALALAALLARPSIYLAVATLLFAMLLPVFYSLWYAQTFENATSEGKN